MFPNKQKVQFKENLCTMVVAKSLNWSMTFSYRFAQNFVNVGQEFVMKTLKMLTPFY